MIIKSGWKAFIKEKWGKVKFNWKYRYSDKLRRKWDKICSYSPVVL